MFGFVAERDVLKFHAPFERGRAPRAGQVSHATLRPKDFAYALEADRSLRDRVGHLRQVAHRLVHLAEVEKEDEQRAGGHLACKHQARAVPQHQAGACGGDDFDDGRQASFHGASPQRRSDAFQALLLEASDLEIFAGKCLDDADRGERFLHHRDHVAFFLAHLARRPFDAAREAVDDQEEQRGDRQRDQREMPVDIKHHAEHADQRQHVDDHAEQRRRDEILHRADVAGDAAD